MTKTRRYKERTFDERPLPQRAAIVVSSVLLAPVIFIYLAPGRLGQARTWTLGATAGCKSSAPGICVLPVLQPLHLQARWNGGHWAFGRWVLWMHCVPFTALNIMAGSNWTP